MQCQPVIAAFTLINTHVNSMLSACGRETIEWQQLAQKSLSTKEKRSVLSTKKKNQLKNDNYLHLEKLIHMLTPAPEKNHSSEFYYFMALRVHICDSQISLFLRVETDTLS